MKIFSVLIIFIFCLSTTTVAQIIETDDCEVIQNEILKLTSDDLVTFDVKGVLYEPEDSILKVQNKHLVKNFLSQIRQNNPRDAERLEGIILLNFKPMLMDKRIPKIIKNAKERGIKVIAITSGRTGGIGSINSCQDLKLSRLKSFGIDFIGSFKLTRLSLEREDKGNHLIGRQSKLVDEAIFKDGVIFTSKRSKGRMLSIFLDKVEFLPKKIVHIDNNIDHISSIERVCKNRNIEFIGIHYTKQYNNKDFLDIKAAEKKLEILRTKSLWVSDKIASCLAHTEFDINYCRSQ